MKSCATSLLALTLLCATSHAQNQRDIAVRQDKERLSDNSSWIYDDLGIAFDVAARTKRPLMIVFR